MVSKLLPSKIIADPLLAQKMLMRSDPSCFFPLFAFQMFCLMSWESTATRMARSRRTNLICPINIQCHNKNKLQKPLFHEINDFCFIHFLIYLGALVLEPIIKQMIDGEQKRLVQEYKSTNRQLRKQLQNLNNEVDKIIAAKTNRIGLKKLPAVQKSLLQTQDARLLQIEVDNLRKRLQHLTRDNESLKQRAQVNHMVRAKQLEDQLAAKQAEKQAIRKEAYWLDKTSKTLNTTDLPEQEMRLYDRIEQTNQELLRCKKVQAELMREVSQMKKYEQRKNSLIEQTVETHKEVKQQAVATSRIEAPVTHQQSKISQQAWKQLKKQFLQLKQAKQHEETLLTQDNDRLRGEIRALQLKMKQKKYTIQNIRSLQIRKKQRNYSTLQNPRMKQEQSIRYRNRKQGYKYSTKT